MKLEFWGNNKMLDSLSQKIIIKQHNYVPLTSELSSGAMTSTIGTGVRTVR